MERLATASPRPTAVFGVVDELAVGAIQAARGVGLRVPEDLSVVGVNDLEIAHSLDDLEEVETTSLSADQTDEIADEVNTKLDLARAYVDMGDGEGASSILEEVLGEGNEGQRQEAQQLLDQLT